MPILSDIYSAGNTLKRRIGGLLDDPKGTLEQFVGQLRDDMNRNSDLMNQAGWGQIDRVKYTPEQRAAAQKQLADIGTRMAMSAATVWHGSPHKFDKFDSSKIGTGEGAQAYGHGLYLAESPEVARGYQKTLSADGFLTGDGRIFDPHKELGHVNVKTAAYKGDLDGAIAKAKAIAESDSPVAKIASNDLAKLEQIKASGGMRPNNGSLYKVDLPDEHIAKMLDWDKPLSQQAPEVQKVLLNHPDVIDQMQKAEAQRLLLNERSPMRLEKIPSASIPYDASRMAGKDALTAIQQRSGVGVTGGVEEQLRKAGIPGIRYLDGGSRGTGQGTSNFVVFPGNEGILKILERNGKPLGLLGD